MKIDILIAVAERGGPENIIRMMIQKLTPLGVQFRVVQMAWEGKHWLDDSVAFYPLTEGKGGHTIVEFCQEYSHLLDETGQIPDLALAAAWPYMNFLAKQVFTERGLRIPVVSWLHTSVDAYARKGFGSWQELLTADAHFAISETIRKEIGQRDRRALVYRLHNPIDAERSEAYLPQEENSLHPKDGLKHTLLFVGRLSKEKNIPFLLQTLRSLPRWKLILAGDGEERSRLESLCDEAGISQRVCWMGWQENPWKYAGQADALVLSSLYEGFPLTAIEALRCGLPVLSTNVDGMAELIRPGINGYLYNVQNPESLCALVSQIEERGFVVENPEQCRTYAREYDSDFALWDMALKMKAICRGVRLRPNTTNHPWYAFRQALSILFLTEEWDTDYLQKTVSSIFCEKNEVLSLRLIFVAEETNQDALQLAHQLEKTYPDKVLLISIPAPCPDSEQEKWIHGQLPRGYLFRPDANQRLGTRELMDALERQIWNEVNHGR